MNIRRRFPVLSSLRAFEAAGRHLSFSRAADELLISQSAVSHHIRKLEDELGVGLFVRRTRAVTLTPEGQRYLADLSKAFDLIAKGTDEVRRSERRTLRVSLLASFATHWLIPRLARFTEAYPDIDLVLEPSIRPADLSTEPIDLAIRYGQGGWEGMQSQRFLIEDISPVCSPDFQKRVGLRYPNDLLKQTLLFSFSKDPFEWKAWSTRAGIDLSDARSLMLHDYNIVIQAAIDGQGVAMGRRTLIADHLKRGVLIEPFHELRISDGIGYWTVMTEQPKPQAKVFAEWLMLEAASAHA